MRGARWMWAVAMFLGVLVLAAGPARAEPGKVTVGALVNKIQDVSFRDNRYTMDFYVWFRWKPEGALADYKPLESFELLNGKIENRGSVVEKKIGDLNYASARITATVAETWDLRAYPFDHHRLKVHIEDSQFFAKDLVFVPDTANSGIGDEIALSGWEANNFAATVTPKVYRSNYGDVSLPTEAKSEYSRFTFGMDLRRESYGYAWKMLVIVFAATGVAILAFMVKPSDLDPRFGLGVGSMFAVAASAFIVASAVPDSGVMTIADHVHMLSMAVIFLSLLQSAYALKVENEQSIEKAKRIDHWSLIVFPLVYFGWAGWVIAGALRAAGR